MKKYSRLRNVKVSIQIGTENKAIKKIEETYIEPLLKATSALSRALKRNNIKITHKRKKLIQNLLQNKTGLCIYIWNEFIGIDKKTIEKESTGYGAKFLNLSIWFSYVYDNDVEHEYIEDYYGDERNEYWIYSKEELGKRMERIMEMDKKELELEFSKELKNLKRLK